MTGVKNIFRYCRDNGEASAPRRLDLRAECLSGQAAGVTVGSTLPSVSGMVAPKAPA